MIYQPFKHIPPYRKGGYDLPPLPSPKEEKEDDRKGIQRKTK